MRGILLVNEVVKRVADGFERVNISDVGLSQSVAIVNCLVEKGEPFTTQTHRWEIIHL